MVRRDPRKHLGVDAPGVGFSQCAQLGAKSIFTIAASDITMNLREVIVPQQLRGKGSFAGCGFADADNIGPATIALEHRDTNDHVISSPLYWSPIK